MRRAALTLAVWVGLAFASTCRPQLVDCYEVAVWDGRAFAPTGEWRCLK